MGLGVNEAFVVGNGMPVILNREGVRLGDEVETGRVLVDGKGVGDVGTLELRDRRHLANHGMVTAVLGVNSKSGEIVYGPELLTRGFVPEEESRDYLEQATAAVREVLTEHSLEAISDWEELRVEVRKALRRFFNRTIQRRPLIVPIIMEL
jgi:ribonuclease J